MFLQFDDLRFVILELHLGQLTAMDGIQDSASVFQRTSLATCCGSRTWHLLAQTSKLGEELQLTNPTRVKQPGIRTVLSNLLRQHLSIAHWMESEERLSKAG